MSWRNIQLVFRREVADQLRDRRTLFMVVILPLLLYPALGVGMLQMSLFFSEQPRTVVILGADELPEPPLLTPDKNRIIDQWFPLEGDSNKLKIVSDATLPTTPQAGIESTGTDVTESAGTDVTVQEKSSAENTGEVTERQLQLTAAMEMRQRFNRIEELRLQILAAEEQKAEEQKPEQETEHKTSTDQPDIAPLEAEISRLTEQISALFTAGNIQVVIIVPEGFRDYVTRQNERLIQRDQSPPEKSLSPKIIRNSADEKSLVAYGRVREAFDAWEQAILNKRLEMANLPTDITSPVNLDRVDLAREEELAANVWSKLFPAMLIVMAMTGAFHPAVDLGAGEKERGTMETLLISPALRSEIVIGKFLTVVVFSLVTALLNLASMGLTGLHILNSAGGGQMQGMDFGMPPVDQLFWVALMAIPLAALFSSVSLALALFARSSKEGQYYLTPLLTITMGLTVFCLSPAVEITPFYSLVPVMGPALLLKGMLLGGAAGVGIYWYLLPVLVSSLLYSVFGLLWAIDQFHSEEVLFRESERFDLRLWVRHLLRDKEATPNFAEAIFCFVLVMLLQFALLNVFSASLQSAGPDGQGLAMIRLLITQQIVIIACPALFMGILLTSNIRRTFHFRLPKPHFWFLGLLLPIVLHPLAVELQVQLAWFFPALPEHAKAALATLGDSKIPPYLIVLAFAVAPAICEEIAFRGFILSGFRRRGREGLAILFSGLLFGIMHMIPQQVFNAALLGLVLGMLTIRSGSIFPAMLFHFMNNLLGVVHGNYGTYRDQSTLLQTLTVTSEQGIHYAPVVLMIAGSLAILLITFLFRADQKTMES